MTRRARSLLQVPQGTEGFYLEEAYRHRKVTAQIENVMYRWGYLPVQTPVFDFFDIYEPLFSGGDERNIYRLIDREGDLLLLRSDITLFIARQMGMALTEEDLPARVCYFDTILRHQEAEDISKNEFFQAGAELIGKPGIEGDLEMLLLLNEVISDLPLPERYYHVGSRAVVDTLFRSLSAAERSSIRHLISSRDREALAESFKAHELPPGRSAYLGELFSLIGERTDLDSMIETGTKKAHITEEESVPLRHLSTIFSQLEELGRAAEWRVDLSEIGSQPYYTGIVYQVYADMLDTSIASGGRYDNLLSTFGFPAPSIGFSMMQRKVETALTDLDRYDPPTSPQKVTAPTFAQAYREASEIRATGRSAVL